MDRQEALFYAYIAHGVYINKFNLDNFQLTAKFENKATDTQGVFGIANSTTFVVAFRGSEETGISDWITDLKFAQRAYPYAGGGRRLQVHSGFMEAYRSVREATIQGAKDTQSDEIVVTGHSLGGGLATLAALDIQYNVGKTVRSYTFGSSKVGNKAFAELYNKRVPQTYRFVNRADVVPSLPPLGWYTHVGELHHLLADQVDAEDANLMTDHFPHNYIKSLRS